MKDVLPCRVEKPLVWLSNSRRVMAPAGRPENPVEIDLDAGVEVDRARLDQLHDRERGEALGDRPGQGMGCPE